MSRLPVIVRVLNAVVWLSLMAGIAAADEPQFVDVPELADIEFVPAKNEETVPEHFRLKPHRFEADAEVLRETGLLRTIAVTFPSPVETAVPENNTVYGEYFQPAGAGPFPGVVVLHILGGEFPLSQTVASSLARAKVAALFIKMPYYGERRSKDSPRRMISRNPRETAEGMTQAVLDVRRAGAWLAARPEVDKQRLGVTGITWAASCPHCRRRGSRGSAKSRSILAAESSARTCGAWNIATRRCSVPNGLKPANRASRFSKRWSRSIRRRMAGCSRTVTC